MAPQGSREEPLDVLASNMEALSSPVRLQLLRALRTPRPLAEIRIGQPVKRAGQTHERPMTRQGVTRHLAKLQRLGLVRRIAQDAKGRGDLYVLDHQRVFAMVDELRNLSRFRPTVLAAASPGATMDRAAAELANPPPGPRLVVAYGREDGAAFQIPRGSPQRIGRSPPCEILLDYDPFLSALHALVGLAPGGVRLTDARSHNGTWVNWKRLPPGASQALRPGDVITVGRTSLVVQS